MDISFSGIYSSDYNKIEPTEEAIREYFKNHNVLTLSGFKNRESANSFAKIFSRRIRSNASLCNCLTSFYEQYGIREEKTEYGYIVYELKFVIKESSIIEMDEEDRQRVESVIKSLKKHKYII